MCLPAKYYPFITMFLFNSRLYLSLFRTHIKLFLLDLSCISTTRIHFYLNLSIGSQLTELSTIIRSFTMGIYSVTELFKLIFPFRQKRQINSQFTDIPIGNSTYIPNISLTTGCNNIFAHLAFQNSRLIPYRRDLCYKIGRFRLTHIISRSIAKHIQRRLQHDIQR